MHDSHHRREHRRSAGPRKRCAPEPRTANPARDRGRSLARTGAFVPLSALATLLAIVAPSALRLRAIGITTVVVASASGLWLLA